MLDELLPYYERELAFFRKLGAEFARKYDKIARRLLLEPDRCQDPHVERLLQGFALIAARIHHRLDDDVPQISDALLGALYPHLLAPIPSFSIAQFETKSGIDQIVPVPQGTVLIAHPLKNSDDRCRFRTCYPVKRWPVDVTDAAWALPSDVGLPADGHTAKVMRLQLTCRKNTFAGLACDDPLRIYLSGEKPAYILYELLFGATYFRRQHQVFVRAADGKGLPRPIKLSPVGFAPDEGLLPYAPRSFLGYRLLQEYFAFAKKFLFFDLALTKEACAGVDGKLDVFFLLNREPPRELTLSKDNFQLGCTPIVNLFSKVAAPITLDHTQTEYRVIPDVRRQSSTEVYSVDEVSSSSPDGVPITSFRPLYSLRFDETQAEHRTFYLTSRRAERDASEVYLTLIDPDLDTARPPLDTLIVKTTCTNRNQAGLLSIGSTQRRTSDFDVEGALDRVSGVYCLEKPTESFHPALGQGAKWRLISHLSLNHLSLTDEKTGLKALQEILAIYDFVNPEKVKNEISGITRLSSKPTVARARDGLPGFCRGLEVTVEINEDKYVGGSAFLFTAVLESFFGMYVSLNSFTQLIATTQQRKEIKRWPPRSGTQILL